MAAMTSTKVEPSSIGEINQAEVLEGGAMTSDNSKAKSVQSRSAAEEQRLHEILDQFRITEFGLEIGTGAHGSIRGTSIVGKRVVIKIHESKLNVLNWDDNVFNITAPHVCSSIGYVKVHDGKDSVASIMPRHLLDLRKLINSKMNKRSSEKPFKYVTAVDLIVQLAIGMNALHEQGIMHRDIKAANLLVTHITPNKKLYGVALADFDGCKSVVGTRFWRAPEVLEALSRGVRTHNFPFTLACDVYSFAVTCSEILTGSTPFPREHWSDYNGVLSGKRPELPAELPQEMESLIHRCWHWDPKKRPTSIEILQTLREMIQKRTELEPLQIRFALADPWSNHKTTTEQPSSEELLKLLESLKHELKVLEQQNEIQAMHFGNEFIKMHEYKSEFGLVNIWHGHRFWEKSKLSLLMIKQGQRVHQQPA